MFFQQTEVGQKWRIEWKKYSDCNLNSISLSTDKPEIEQEETFIHTGEGDQTEVICIVHSSPRANITWYKDGTQITGDNPEYLMNQRGNRHTLTIPGVDSSKFGKYTCQAKNHLGVDQKTTEVSGKQNYIPVIFSVKKRSDVGKTNWNVEKVAECV